MVVPSKTSRLVGKDHTFLVENSNTPHIGVLKIIEYLDVRNEDESLHNINFMCTSNFILYCFKLVVLVMHILLEMNYFTVMIFVATAIATSFNQLVSVFSIFFCLVQQTVQQLSTKLSRLERCGMSQLCK